MTAEIIYPGCKKCGRSMRPQNSLAGDHPGTINTGARGFCATCYYKEVRNKGLTRSYRRAGDPKIAADQAGEIVVAEPESVWTADEKQVVVTVALRRKGAERKEILQILGLLNGLGEPQNGPRNAIPANATFSFSSH